MRLAGILRRLADYSMPLIFAACVAAAAAPVVRVLELRGAIAFGVAVMAWLFFGRLIVFGLFAYALHRLTSLRIAYVVCSAITDAPIVGAAIALDIRLIWGAVVAVVVAEAVFCGLLRVEAKDEGR